MAIPTGRPREGQNIVPVGVATGEDRSRLHEQHRQIERHVRDLGDRLAPLAGRATPGELRNDIAGRFSRLQSELAEHFADEERMGFLPAALTQAPRLTRRARHVLEEHDLLRIQLSKLVSRLARGTADWGEMREDFGGFQNLLGEHERKESALINEAYLDDLGGPG